MPVMMKYRPEIEIAKKVNCLVTRIILILAMVVSFFSTILGSTCFYGLLSSSVLSAEFFGKFSLSFYD